jgi:hypothetical protein
MEQASAAQASTGEPLSRGTSVSDACIIDFHRRFRIPAPPERVWSYLDELEHHGSWRSWLKEVRVEGDGLHAGAVIHGVIKPPLPYRVHLDVVLTHCLPARRVDALVEGDLEGHGRVLLAFEEGATRADVAWTVEVKNLPIRLLMRVARPVVIWAHNSVVEAAVADICSHVA